MVFVSMDSGTPEDWQQINKAHEPIIANMPARIKAMLHELQNITGGFAIDQLQHCLQTATLAERGGASEEMVLISLCHDIGKVASVVNHGPIAAEMLKPYISEHAYHILRTHQDFQGKHYYHFFDMPRNLRDQYADEPWYEDAVRFTDCWDQAAFDPDYDSLSLEHFEPLIDRFFAAPGAVLSVTAKAS